MESGPRRAFALYDAKVCFTVDLETGRVSLAEVFTNSLEHFDTGLDASPGDGAGWARAQAEAQEAVAGFLRERLNDAPLLWNTESADE